MKKIGIGLLILVLLIIGSVVGFATLVDPNMFKPMISSQVRQATDRNLVISGDLAWTFWPRLGIAMGEAELGNPPGMEELQPLFAMGSADLSVDVLPLFKKQLHIGEIVVHDVAVNLLTLEDGRSNLDGLSGREAGEETVPAPPQPPVKPEPEVAAIPADWAVQLEGVRIVNAAIRIDDRQADTKTEVRDLNLMLSRFAPGEWVVIELESRADVDQIRTANTLQAEARLAADFTTLELRGVQAGIQVQGPDIPGGRKDLDVQGQVLVELEKQSVVVDPLLISLDALRLAGDLRVDYSAKPDIVAAFTADTLDLNPLLAELRELQAARDASGQAQVDSENSGSIPSQGDARSAGSGPGDGTGAQSGAEQGKLSQVEPDLSGLQAVNAQVSLNVGTLLADKVRLTDSRLALNLRDGQLTLQDLSTNTFDGAITLSALLDGGATPPTYIADLQVSGVQAQEALIALAGTDLLSGTAAVTAKLQGTGLSEHAVLHGVRGNLTLNFADGAIWGVNIPLEVRRVHAAFRGRTIEESDAVQKTDFTSLSGSFQIGEGRAVTRDLSMASPLLRMDGQGFLELPAQVMDMGLNVGIVGTLEGQYGKDWTELQGLTIPLRISGPVSKPKFSLNTDDVLRQRATQEAEKLKGKAQEEIERSLRQQLGDDAEEGLGGLLKKLF